MRRLGIDVGGTHTDAVIMDGKEIISSHKAITSRDISTGIEEAARQALVISSLDGASIDAVMIGTTQFTNAIIQRSNLTRVAALRIGAQSTSALPPFYNWPPDLDNAVQGMAVMINGGHEYDGTELVPLDDKALGEAIEQMGQERLESLAVCSMFSSVNPQSENDIKELCTNHEWVKYVSLSNELGGIGLYQRENATLLNAALMPVASKIIKAFIDAFNVLGITGKLYISQNDGTLMDAEFAVNYPVLTISSGPTNSMRGAAFLTGLSDAIVIDVGGTTSDIGMLANGFPRRSQIEVEIGGVLTNFRMPDVLAIGLAGGSIVKERGKRIGPGSVGHELAQKAICFGGDTMTATDIVCASGRSQLGVSARLEHIEHEIIDNALLTITSTYARVVDRMKTSPDDFPLIVVGGGGFLVPDDLPGINAVHRPEFAEVANAIGAAMGQIGGEAEVVYSRDKQKRDDAHEQARQMATERAIKAGAERTSIEIMEVDEVPVSYLEEPIVRLRVKAVGEMRL